MPGLKRQIVDGRLQCNCCRRWKTLDLFHCNKAATIGHFGRCKACMDSARRQHEYVCELCGETGLGRKGQKFCSVAHAKRARIHRVEVAGKLRCGCCHKLKLVVLFSRTRYTLTGRSNTCKVCTEKSKRHTLFTCEACDRKDVGLKGQRFCTRECRSRGMSGSRSANWKGGTHINHYGYVIINAITVGGQRQTAQMEHRIIMEDTLGRRLFADETVHHINGIRHDNRVQNLELWTKNHPTGQRVLDKVIWAEELLHRYAPEKLVARLRVANSG